jgi:translocation protein SEC62
VNLFFSLCSQLQVESFIPLWEWDLPKKKSKKRKGKEPKSSAAQSAEKLSANGAYIEEVDDSGDGSSRPHSRNATVEEVPED